MSDINKLNKIFSKMLLTFKEFRKTAYHHYGENPLSFIKFIYYSGIRINTFLIFENDLSKELVEPGLEDDLRVIKPSLKKLGEIREGKNLPREFYYDKIFDTTICYLAFKGDELAYIHWVFGHKDYSRFLILREGVAELNYNTTLPQFRGKWLSAKMMAYISKDLKEAGYKKVMGVIHEFNYPSIKCIEKAGFREVKRIKALGPFHRKIRV